MTVSIRSLAAAALVAAVAATVTVAAVPASAQGEDQGLLEASVAGSLPSDPPIAGLTPGGAPWVIDPLSSIEVEEGKIQAKIYGLVIPTLVPPSNPVATLSASLVCGGAVVATTPAVPFSPQGNATIKARVTVPERCIAPAVLLNPNGSTTRYIGVTGQE
jgi:hypothetical protein